MKKITMTPLRLAMTALCIAISPLSAQSPAAPAEPRTPLLPRMPAFSSWNIAFQYAGEDKQARPDAPPRHLGNVPRRVVVTKTKDVCREQVQLATGKQVERWDFAGTQFHSDEDGIVFLIIPPSEETPDPEYYDRRRSDFPELNWINKSNYLGVEDFRGKPAFHFEAEKDGKKFSAFLSVESQMPLAFSDGSATRLYNLNPPPSGQLEPPPAFLSAYNRHKQAMDALRYRPSPP
jgi:hypothetical protein